MNKSQINKWRMYSATVTLLDANNDLVSIVPDITQKLTDLKLKMSLIDTNLQVQETEHKGITIEKNKLREDLRTLTLKVSEAVSAYAVTIKNQDLKTRSTYKPSQLRDYSDPELIDVALLIKNLAVPIVSDLGKFFISQTDIDSLLDLTEKFRGMLPLKRSANNVSKVATVNLAKTFKEIDKLFSEEIDLLISPFRFSKPDFYSMYKNARMIVDYVTGRTKKETEKPAAV